MIGEMNIQIDEAKNNVERVIDLLRGREDDPTRTKRGVLNFVGSITRVLFGIVDRNTELELRNLIEISANDTKELSRLLANQTEMVCTEFGKIRESDESLQRAIEDITMTLTYESQSNNIARAVMLLSDNIMQFEFDTAILTDGVLFATQGALHPRFVAPSQIQQSAETVEKHIPDAIFPTIVTGGNMANVIKASELQIILKNGMLIYQLAIPLIDYAQFTLYRATPLPVRQHNLNGSSTYAYIWPENHYVAIGEAQDTYLSFTSEALSKCKDINNVKICRDNEPVRTISEFSPCEVQLAVNRTEIDFSKCKIKIIKLATAYWIRLLANNEWAFSTDKPQQILTKCKQLADRILKIKGTGVLRLPNSCSGKTTDARLTAHREIVTNAETQALESSYLDINNILTKIDPTYSYLIQNIIDDEAPIAISKDEHTGSLRQGRDLHEIIERARALGEYKKIYFQYSSLENNLFWGGIIILTIVSCISLYLLGSVLGRPLKLTCLRMFSGKNKDTGNGQRLKWHENEQNPIPKDIEKQTSSEPDLSTIHSIASNSQQIIVELPPKKNHKITYNVPTRASIEYATIR